MHKALSQKAKNITKGPIEKDYDQKPKRPTSRKIYNFFSI